MKVHIFTKKKNSGRRSLSERQKGQQVPELHHISSTGRSPRGHPTTFCTLLGHTERQWGFVHVPKEKTKKIETLSVSLLKPPSDKLSHQKRINGSLNCKCEQVEKCQLILLQCSHGYICTVSR